MPEVVLPRLLLKERHTSSLTVNSDSLCNILSFISSHLNVPSEVFLKNEMTLAGGIALFCNGVAVYDLQYVLQESDQLEIVMALSGG